MEHVTDLAPTSSAATADTEPEIVAGISSAEGGPDMPTDIRVGGAGIGPGTMLALLAGGVAVGFGLARFLRRS